MSAAGLVSPDPNPASDGLEAISAAEVIAEALQTHPALENWRECGCGEWRAWTSDGPNGCYEEHAAAAILAALGLEEEWSDDVAGPSWARYCRLVTPSVTHHGPTYLESKARLAAKYPAGLPVGEEADK